MGEIFRARDRDTGDTVALKVLIEQRTPDTRRFEREAKVLSELRHPGIVRYVAHGATPAGRPWLAMEWLEGEDLASLLLRRALSLDEVLALGARVADALAAVHARGVVHRDLKPSNLFLAGGRIEEVKVLDFGIARLGGTTRMTRTGAVVGTPGYLAPEQVRSGEAIDARADVFALGCVLFECLAGAPAFQGEHVMAVLAKILFEEPPALPRAPAALAALIERMLAKSPAERPRDGAAVAEAIAALGPLAPEPVEPRAPARMVGERRLLSVVLLGRTQTVTTLAPSPLSVTVEVDADPAPTRDDLRRAAEAHGGCFELLHDGSVVVTIAGTGVATDLAAQAARCALALRALVPEGTVALATGRAELLGSMPLGDAIDRAARMLARPAGGVGVDDVTAGLLDGRFVVKERDTGLELAGAREASEGARTLLGRPTTCVGRERELSLLEALWTECVEEPRAQAVLVTAPAGLGKSRLAYELTRRIEGRGARASIWTGRVDSLRAGSAFGLLGQALRYALGIHDGAPLDTRRRTLAARVAERVPPSDAARVAAFLGELVGTPFPAEDDAPLRAARKDTQLMGEQMRRAFLDLLRAEAARQPVLLVLEDLHWGDLPTVRFVDAALRDLGDRPWMVLALARLEVHELFPQLWVERGAQHVGLKPLTRRASEQLARQVLGDAVGADTIERLVTQADGHAFYLEELIRAVAERKGAALPETVLAMVQARLEALDPEARRVLRAASIFGEVAWPGGVAALLGDAPPERAGEWLARLVDLEVLVRRPESRFPGEPELAFRHALLREGAYAMLTDDDRRLGHRLAAAWLAEHGEGDAMVLAEHCERGGELARAGAHYLRAAEQAIRGVDMTSAVARAERGLACGAATEIRASLLGMLCEAHVYRHELMISVAPYAEEALRIATPGSAPWAQAASAKVLRALGLGQRDEVEAMLRALLVVEPSPDAMGAVALLFASAVYMTDTQGSPADAERFLERFHAIVDPVAAREPHAAAWLAIIEALREATFREDPFAGLARAVDSRALFLEVNHRNAAACAKIFEAMSRWFLGDADRAEPVLRDIVIPDEDLGVSSSVRPFALSLLLAERGALDEARDVARALAATGHARHLAFDEGRGRWALADALRRAGALDEAEREALAALSLFAAAPVDHVGATATLAAVHLAQGRTAEALARAEDAMARYRAIGACGFFRGGFASLVHAEALHAAGDRARAREAIAAARARIATIAARIPDPDLRESFLTRVPENLRALALARAWLGE
jgi:hypothetical protein